MVRSSPAVHDPHVAVTVLTVLVQNAVTYVWLSIGEAMGSSQAAHNVVARSLTGWTGGVAWAAHPAAEMLTGGSVAGTTYVGRHLAVLRTTKKAGSGWVIDGAPTMLFYIFFIFRRGACR